MTDGVGVPSREACDDRTEHKLDLRLSEDVGQLAEQLERVVQLLARVLVVLAAAVQQALAEASRLPAAFRSSSAKAPSGKSGRAAALAATIAMPAATGRRR